MPSIDAATWQAVGVTLSVVALLLAVVLWRARGVATGLRAVAWALLPAAAGLTGTLRLLWQIGDSIVEWAVRLVFSPVVWAGIVLTGISLALFAVSAALRSRGTKRPTGRPEPLPSQRSRPAARTTGPPAGSRPAVQDDDMDDIEAILRRHGIS